MIRRIAVDISLGCLFVAATVFSQGELLLTRGQARIDQRERIAQEGARAPLPAKRPTALYRLGRLMGGSVKRKR
jgi:hypothetical protein